VDIALFIDDGESESLTPSWPGHFDFFGDEVFEARIRDIRIENMLFAKVSFCASKSVDRHGKIQDVMYTPRQAIPSSPVRANPMLTVPDAPAV